MSDIRCPCGDDHADKQAVVDMIMPLVRRHGEKIVVRVGRRSWLVSMLYIGLHGLGAWEMDDLAGRGLAEEEKP